MTSKAEQASANQIFLLSILIFYTKENNAILDTYKTFNENILYFLHLYLLKGLTRIRKNGLFFAETAQRLCISYVW